MGAVGAPSACSVSARRLSRTCVPKRSSRAPCCAHTSQRAERTLAADARRRGVRVRASVPFFHRRVSDPAPPPTHATSQRLNVCFVADGADNKSTRSHYPVFVRAECAWLGFVACANGGLGTRRSVSRARALVRPALEAAQSHGGAWCVTAAGLWLLQGLTPTGTGIHLHCDRPLRRACVVGCVVDVIVTRKFTRFAGANTHPSAVCMPLTCLFTVCCTPTFVAVDDGTGCALCLVWTSSCDLTGAAVFVTSPGEKRALMTGTRCTVYRPSARGCRRSVVRAVARRLGARQGQSVLAWRPDAGGRHSVRCAAGRRRHIPQTHPQL